VVCYCEHVQVLPTRTQVLLLQHPRERRMGVGTARMAHLSLPGSLLRVGCDFAEDPVVREVLATAPARYLLFPGPGAEEVGRLPRDRPVTLVVLDGTWWQARKLLKLNPALAALPRVAFTPRRPSDYRIRRQPAPFCVSTIEALAEVLAVLEPEGGPFDGLLAPFQAMVERQEWFETHLRTHRHRRPRARGGGTRPTLAGRLRAEWPRLLCVQGDANAWPTRDPARREPEIVHWVAHRPATGESYEAVVAPRRPLAPSTPDHVDLAEARLTAGESAEAWRRSWQTFVRPDDLVVHWGTFHRSLAAAEGLALPAGGMDLRTELSQLWRQRTPTVEESARRLSAAAPALGHEGRAGRRLAALVGVLRALVA
jgi:DTW domain-containing protein YfiP